MPFVFVCLFIVTVFVVSAFAYPAFVALIDIEYSLAPVTCGIVVLYVPPFSEYSIVVPVGFVLTAVNALWAFPSYFPLYAVAFMVIFPIFTVAIYVAVCAS